MTDIVNTHIQIPHCPLCAGSMTLIESRARTKPDKLVNVYKCNDCGVHYPRVIEELAQQAASQPQDGAIKTPQ